MSGFIKQKWADVSGKRMVNGTVVDSFVRTDPNGPVWSLRCSCSRYFTVPHSRIGAALESGAPVYCGQCTVPTGESTSLKEIRRAEREVRQQAAREDAKHQAQAAQKSAQEQAEREYLNSFRADHHRYALQQINQGTPLEEIMSLDRFAAQGNEVRKRIMEAVERAGG